MAKTTTPWQFYGFHQGVALAHRPGLQRRGWMSIYHNPYRDDRRIAGFVHHTFNNAIVHANRILRDGGAAATVTEAEARGYIGDDNRT